MDKQNILDDTFLQEFNFSDPLTEKDISSIEKFLDKAYDIRKFEIEMYWKRATYFWGFIAVSYTLFVLLNTSKINVEKKELATLQLLVTSLGLIFSYGWYIVNRGSKFWTKNWHEIIDFLEGLIKRPFHRLKMSSENSLLKVFSHYRFSVTDTNLIISFFNFLVWVIITIATIIKLFDDIFYTDDIFKNINIYISTLTSLTIFALTFQRQIIKTRKIAVGLK
jgi:hypothetical protein